jgi:hypothetical protein
VTSPMPVSSGSASRARGSLQVAHNAMARPMRPRAGADHRNRAHAGQDVAQVGSE